MGHQEIRLHKIPTDLNDRVNAICKHFGKHRTQIMRPLLRELVEEKRALLDGEKACTQTTEYRIPMVNDDIAHDFYRIASHTNTSPSDLIIPKIEQFTEEYRALWDIPGKKLDR